MLKGEMTTDDHELPEYWIDKVQSPFTSDVTSFWKDDIEPEKKLKLEDVKTIVSDRYGKRSKHISDENFLKLVTEENYRIRKRVFAEASPLVTSIFCSLAEISGISKSNGGTFLFRHIPNGFIHNWDLKNLVNFFFVIRAAWDDNPNWILVAEKKIMGQLCYVYSDGFTSTLKNMGFIARIIAIARTRRLRELNNLLANKTGYRITVKNLTDTKERRKPCLLQPEVMLQRDTTKNSIISDDHNKEEILKACEEYNGEINVQEYQHSFLRNDAFLIARDKFSITNQDYSNVINTKELKEDENEKQKEEGKEDSDSSVDVEELFRVFNVEEKR